VKVRSADGYAVSVDVTIKFRILPGSAHKLYQDTGSRDQYKDIVRNESEKACISLFGKMRTEDFYNPEQRRVREAEAKDLLMGSLGDNYVEVIDVLMRDVEFDPDYENEIRRKKLEDQKSELNEAAERASTMRGKAEVVEADTNAKLKVIDEEKTAELVTMQAETDKEIAKIKADADKYVTEKRADADLVKAQKEAEGQLLVKTAEAEGEKLRNAAMLGVGGSTIVALEAARNLNFSDVTISTLEVDLLDIDAMATKLGVPEGRGR
jgi:regulator of protease activity HflC (stomatin/prohibitin superfamily)